MKRHYPAVAARAGWRCEYCHAPEEVFNGRFDVEHVQPRSQGGADALANLALGCGPCNTYKSDATAAVDPITGEAVRLFNPRLDLWADHFRVTDAELVEGLTPTGRATIIRLRLNAPRQIRARAIWRLSGRFPEPAR